MARQQITRLIMIAALAGIGSWACQLAVSVPDASAGSIEVTSCSGYGDGGSDADLAGMVWNGTSNGSFSTSNECGQGRSFQIAPAGRPKRGETALWETTSPPPIAIVHALTPVNQVLIDSANGDGFGASFFWDGGSQAIARENNCCGGTDYGSGINRYLGPSHHFGWTVTCQDSSCGQPLQILDVRGVDLLATDNTPPGVVALGSNNVWYQSGRWIRGAGWPASFQASADAGICSMRAIIAGNSIQGPFDGAPNRHSWTQCPTPQTMALALDTTEYPNGTLPIILSASDAASPANVSSPATTLHLDNSPVVLSLSGPADASIAAGSTQYVTASAAAGPSGVSGIYCSVDGGSSGFYPGASARVPVSGLGPHAIVCHAANNAIDPSGQPASSPTETFNLSIRQPTAAAISFSRIADALRCHGVTVKVHVKGKPRTVKRHGRKVRVPGRTRVVKHRVRRCHARTVLRKVNVIVKRHGKPVKITKVRRVALLPHKVNKPKLRVAYGKATTVSGYLGLANGTALGGRSVLVLSAPDNGLGHFTPMASVVTNTDGGWSARVPPGPSRLIEAVYGGDSTTEPASSATVMLTVPARIRVSITPRTVLWSGLITIRGQLKGGYVPPDGVALRVLVRYPGNRRPSSLLALRTNANGGFTVHWTYGSGRGIATYPFSVATTASESDYPFAATESRRIGVTFGRHTPLPPHHHARKRHHPHTASHHHKKPKRK